MSERSSTKLFYFFANYHLKCPPSVVTKNNEIYETHNISWTTKSILTKYVPNWCFHRVLKVKVESRCDIAVCWNLVVYIYIYPIYISTKSAYDRHTLTCNTKIKYNKIPDHLSKFSFDVLRSEKKIIHDINMLFKLKHQDNYSY